MVASPSADEDPDATLVQRAREGDTSAFDELVVRHSRRIYGLIYNMTSHHEDTNDLMQEVFTRAFRSLKRFQGRSKFSTWLYSVAVNLTLNFLKKRKRRTMMSLDDIDNGIVNNEVFIDLSNRANPIQQMEIHEIQKRLNTALQSLSEDHRAVVTMFDIQQLPHAEISRILGVSEGTVRSRLFYAHRHLQSLLGDLLAK